MRRRPTALLAVILGVLATAMLAPTGDAPAVGAQVSSSKVAFRAAGGAWASTLPAPLFDEQLVWVPGDSRTETFSVRNESGEDARMVVDAVSSTTMDDLVRVGDLTVEARADGEEWRSTTDPGTHELSSMRIAPGEVQTIDVRVTLPWDAGNPSQAHSLMFDLRVTLSETPSGGPRSDPAAEQDPGGGGRLPTTGGFLSPALAVSAGAMIVVGAVLSVRRRPKARSVQAGDAP